MRLTQKQIGFVLDIVKEIKPGQAYLNHYKVKSTAVADACASRLLKTAKVQAYHKELLIKMEDETIAAPKERKQILTEIARAAIPDYVTEDGIKVDKHSPNVRAVSEIETRTRMGKQGTFTITKFKLHNPEPAIDLLNKMDKIYSEGTVNVDNRTVNIIVSSEKAKELTERLMEGERTDAV